MPSEGGLRQAVDGTGAAAHVLAFHKSINEFSWGATNFSPSRLGRLLRFIVGEGYRLVSLAEASASPQHNVVAVTFDDGYRHLREVLPSIMAEFGFRPTVFMPTAHIGCDNDWDYSHALASCPHLDADDISALAQGGVEFGSHSHKHGDLTRLGRVELQSELQQSRERLQELTGQPISSISYPFGRHNAIVCHAAEQAGYEHGYTMAFPETGQADLARGRIAVYGFDTPLSVLKKLRPGTIGYRVERWKAAVTNRLSGGSILLDQWRGSGQ
jgi:peptidoglycan/xylan/chitin deacetylase (PgdA/CDA1 family)